MNECSGLASVLPEGPPEWVVQCDFDGTISVDDVTDSLLIRFGRDGWQALESAWERGEIGSRECMTRQVALLDMSETELVAHLDQMAIDPHFPAFVGKVQALAMPLQVVSDGLDRAITHILRNHGLQALPVFANQLLQAGERRWTLRAPHADATCLRASGNCKCARAADEQSLSRRVLYIGDGSSDFCVSGMADQVLAKSSLIGHCRAQGIAYQPFHDFAEALGLLEAITANGGSARASTARRMPGPDSTAVRIHAEMAR